MILSQSSEIQTDKIFRFWLPWKGILTGKTRRQTRKWLDEKEEEKIFGKI